MTSENRFIYRGISRDYTKGFIRSGAAVRLDSQNKGEYTYSEYLAYIRTLITEVKQHYPENYAGWTDLEILGDLQHNGAATCLVDFSKNLLISLWFACGGDITYIQHLLGHSSVVTTQIYTHVNLQKQHEILSKKHPRRLI
jgi:hypothetical protein